MGDLAMVKTTIGTLRLKPGFQEETADESIFGRLVTILEKHKDGWYFVETDYRYKGYIHESQLLIDSKRAESWDKEANHIINHKIIDVLQEPKYQSYSTILLTKGAVVKITGKINGDWAEIELPNRETGWVRSSFLSERIRPIKKIKNDEALIRKKVVNTALSYLGTQYRWGGKTPLGLDCSGLCSISYLLNGIIIYRDARIAKEFSMREIPFGEIKPGDMLYWPGHVAMYIGKGKYVHSTGASSGVVINSLNPDESGFRKDLVEVKQVGTVF